MDALPYILFYLCALYAPMCTIYGAFFKKAPVIEADKVANAWLLLKRRNNKPIRRRL